MKNKNNKTNKSRKRIKLISGLENVFKKSSVELDNFIMTSCAIFTGPAAAYSTIKLPEEHPFAAGMIGSFGAIAFATGFYYAVKMYYRQLNNKN